MTTRDRMLGTVLGPVDLEDQPELPYIFLIDTAAGGRQAFAVDSFFIGDGYVYGYRGGLSVIAVPLAASWTILHRDLVIFRTVEESIRKQNADGKAEFELIQSLSEPPSERPSPEPPVMLLPPVGHYI